MDNQQPNQQPPYQIQPPQEPYQPYYQPNYAQSQRPPKPDNYLVWAILTTLFCCLPLGIISIVYAAKVDSQYNAGDYAGAQDSSNKAKTLAIWAAISVVITIILAAFLGILGNVFDSI